MGLGGGFVLTMYTKATKSVATLIARERAPLAAHKDMFKNMTVATGILSVAVPGELKGYWELHQKYGTLPWKTLIQPTIDLCRKGHVVTKYLAKVLTRYGSRVYNSPSLSEIFVNPKTNKVWEAGDLIQRLDLAKTLEIIAKEGAAALYSQNGTLLRPLVDEIRSLGGIITQDDFLNYEVEWGKPVSIELPQNRKLYSVPLPASGLTLSLILNVLKGYKPEESLTYFQRIVEAYKFAYGRRTLLGDERLDPEMLNNFSNPSFAKHIREMIRDNETFNDVHHYGAQFANTEDHGTAHINILTANGDAVAVTSTINTMYINFVNLCFTNSFNF